jgi:hypothetical protein
LRSTLNAWFGVVTPSVGFLCDASFDPTARLASSTG